MPPIFCGANHNMHQEIKNRGVTPLFEPHPRSSAVERPAFNRVVVGSIPTAGISFCRCDIDTVVTTLLLVFGLFPCDTDGAAKAL